RRGAAVPQLACPLYGLRSEIGKQLPRGRTAISRGGRSVGKRPPIDERRHAQVKQLSNPNRRREGGKGKDAARRGQRHPDCQYHPTPKGVVSGGRSRGLMALGAAPQPLRPEVVSSSVFERCFARASRGGGRGCSVFPTPNSSHARA